MPTLVHGMYYEQMRCLVVFCSIFDSLKWLLLNLSMNLVASKLEFHITKNICIKQLPGGLFSVLKRSMYGNVNTTDFCG